MTQYTENGTLVNLINLTPHAVNFVTADGRQVDVQPEGVVARLEQKDVFSRWIGRIPVYKTEYGQVQNLPDPQPDTIYIVSGMVLSQVPSSEMMQGRSSEPAASRRSASLLAILPKKPVTKSWLCPNDMSKRHKEAFGFLFFVSFCIFTQKKQRAFPDHTGTPTISSFCLASFNVFSICYIYTKFL